MSTWEEWDSNPRGNVGAHYGGRFWVQILSSAASDLGHIPYMTPGKHGKALITYVSIYCIVKSSQIIWREIILYFSPKAWNLKRHELTQPLSRERDMAAVAPWAAIESMRLVIYTKKWSDTQWWSLNIFAQIAPSIKTFLSINFQHIHILYTSITILKSHIT